MNPYDRGSAFAIGSDGLLCQSREMKEWHGCRSTKGVTKGKYYYEVMYCYNCVLSANMAEQPSKLKKL